MTALVEFTDRPLPAPVDTDSWTGMFHDVVELVRYVYESEFVPKTFRGNAPATAAAILYGREVGLPPMTALTQLYVVDGRPAMYAEGQRALILAAGHDLDIREATGARCVIAGRRRGSNRWLEVEWTLDHARQAKLLPAKAGSGWLNYPGDMLIARATAKLARMLFSDVIHGFRAVEELTDEIITTTPALAAAEPKTTVQRKSAQSRRKTSHKAEQPDSAPVSSSPDTATHAATGDQPPPPPLPGEPGYTDFGTDASQGAETPARPLPAAAGDPEQTGASDAPGTVSAPPKETSAASPIAAEETSLPGGAEAPTAIPPSEVEVVGPEHAEATDRPAPPAVGEPVDDDVEVLDAGDEPIRKNERIALLIDFEKFLGPNRDDPGRARRLAITGALIGRQITSSNDLTHREARQVLDTLAMCRDRADLEQIVEAAVAYRANREKTAADEEPAP